MAKEPFAAKLTSIWIGGIIFWSLNGFKGNFKDQLLEKYESRNLWVGYIVTLIFGGFIIYLIATFNY